MSNLAKYDYSPSEESVICRLIIVSLYLIKEITCKDLVKYLMETSDYVVITGRQIVSRIG